MDALLVRLPNLKSPDYREYADFSPDSLLSLGSYLTACGYTCRISDVYLAHCNGLLSQPGAPAKDVGFLCAYVAAAVRKHQPAVVGFTGMSDGDSWAASQVAAALKEQLPDIHVILGGYFATVNAADILEACPGVDAIVCGEGEYPMAAILARIRGGLPPFTAEVPGLCFRENSTTRITPRPPMFDLATAPPLDFSILPNPIGYRFLSYHLTRGCPWNCGYCIERKMQPKYRAKSLDLLVRDVQNFRALNPRFRLYLEDPIPAVNAESARALAQVLSGLSVSYMMSSRVDTLNPELVPALRQSGCGCIYFGLESASFDTLVRMNKLRPANWAQYERYLNGARSAITACARAGVQPVIGVMIGYPGETPEDLRVTLQFVRELKLIFHANAIAGAAPLHMLPFRVWLVRGSDLWEARQYYFTKGLEIDDAGLFGEHRVVRASDSLDPEGLDRFQAEVTALFAEASSADRASGLET